MRRGGTIIAFALLACFCGPAFAQLPSLPLPEGLPPIGDTVRGTLRGALGETRDLVDLRQLRVRDLLRRHRQELEADPNGEPIVRREVLAWSPSPEALAQARAAGFEIVRDVALAELGGGLVTLRAPRGLSTRRALRRLRELDPGGTYDFNHLYTESGPAPGAAPTGDAGGVRVGLIDGGVDEACPALADARIVSRGFAGATEKSAHGTAIAAILVGRSRDMRGVAPAAQLYAADVYGAAPTGGSADRIAQALAWMARERIGVVNVSLVGPDNGALRAAVRAALGRGHVIVAAVGNDGPAARPLYPAAYEGVVGVTAVDAQRRILPEAVRGAQVDFAALGARRAPVGANGAAVAVRGTSYAAPIVAGLLARDLAAPEPRAAQNAVAALTRAAVDLGPRGRDNTYGAGLVGGKHAASARAGAGR